MQAAKIKFETVDRYIATFPDDVRAILEKMRKTIKQAAPDAEEVISYGMPAYKQHGMLLYFAAFKKHYSLFIPQALKVINIFSDELSVFEIHKATFKIGSDQPFPFELLGRIAKLRVEENTENAKLKKK